MAQLDRRQARRSNIALAIARVSFFVPRFAAAAIATELANSLASSSKISSSHRPLFPFSSWANPNEVTALPHRAAGANRL